MILDILAKTGDPRMVYVRKQKKFGDKLSNLGLTQNLKDETYKKLTDLIDQFNKLVDDCIESEDK